MPTASHQRRLLFAVVLTALAARPAAAVVIQTTTGTGNTTAPVNLPEFNNIGYSTNGLGSAIYLGDGWVLTAEHVSGNGIILASGTYLRQEGTQVILQNNTVGKSANTDLFMYKLQTSPVGLPSLTIASSQRTVGQSIAMVGGGRDRGAFTEWFVDQSATPWTWTETTGTAVNAAGYQTLSSRTIRWGTNQVFNNDLWFAVNGNDVRGFYSTFTAAAGSNEAQAVLGDSGGAIFTLNGSQWELSGVISAVGGYSGQPSPFLTPVFGNATYMADLSYYRSQIVATVPEPGTLALVATGLAGLLPLARSQRRRRSLR